MSGFEQSGNLHSGEPKKGRVLRISGTIIDVQFDAHRVPEINNQLIIIPSSLVKQGMQAQIHLEVAQHLGDGVARCIALESLGGVTRGLEVLDTGGPIIVPVGPQVLGRIFDVIGRPIDGLGPIKTEEKYSNPFK